jgi:Fe-S cluster biosynthesis and repair protein YggX
VAERLVQCIKLGSQLPGIRYQPFRGELGRRIFENVSQDAWQMWIEHSKMIVNEYRLDLTSEKAHGLLKEQCELFFFGEDQQGMAPPPDYVPET